MADAGKNSKMETAFSVASSTPLSAETSPILTGSHEFDDRLWKDGALAVRESKRKVRAIGGQVLSDIWIHYYVSVHKNAITKRYQAKCRYCKMVLSGRNEQLMAHCESVCPSIPMEQRADVFRLRALKQKHVPNPGTPAERIEDDQTLVLLRPSPNQSPERHSSKMTHQLDVPWLPFADQEYADRMLTRALIDTGTCFKLVDNWFFIQFLQFLRPAYQAPSSKMVSEVLMPKDFAQYSLELAQELSSVNDLTLSLDGWEDKKGRSVYAFIASSTQSQQPHILDVVDLSSVRHTAENLKEQTALVLQRLGINMRKFKAVVTDNLPVMARFRHLFTADYPHIANLQSITHGVNLLAAGYLKHPMSKDVLKKSSRLVNYFRFSHFWSEKLRSWSQANGVQGQLETYTETKWSSVANVFRSVSDYEPGFRWCLQYLDRTRENTPELPTDIQELIKDRSHFGNNEVCSMFTKIIAKSIAQIEHPDVAIGECLFWYIKLYKATKELNVSVVYEDFKRHCLGTIQKRFLEFFKSPLYILGMTLDPRFRDLALSLTYKIRDAYEDSLIIASLWNFTKAEAKELRGALKDYSKGEGFYPDYKNNATDDPYAWWNRVMTSKHVGVLPLRKLALGVHGIVPNAADTERLFSADFGCQSSSNFRNNLSPTMLKRIGQLKRYYLQLKRGYDGNKHTPLQKKIKLDPGTSVSMQTFGTPETNNVILGSSFDEVSKCRRTSLANSEEAMDYAVELEEFCVQELLCEDESPFTDSLTSDNTPEVASAKLNRWLASMMAVEEVSFENPGLEPDRTAMDPVLPPFGRSRNCSMSGQAVGSFHYKQRGGWSSILQANPPIDSIFDLQHASLAKEWVMIPTPQNDQVNSSCTRVRKSDDECTDWSPMDIPVSDSDDSS